MTQATSTRRPLLKAAEVCDIAKVQPYVLRSWEKEFPSLGVSKDPEGPRYYRRADLDEVLRIKQLVYGEGLTIAGVRRKLEEERTTPPDGLPFDDDVGEEPAGKSSAKLSAKARTRIDGIRKGLRAILELLDKPSGRRPAGSNGEARGGSPAGSSAAGTRRARPSPAPAARSKNRRSSGSSRRAS